MAGTSERATRVAASAEARLVGLVVAATDLLPAGIRYGPLRSVTQRVFVRAPLPVVTGAPKAAQPSRSSITVATTGPRVTLATGRLDMGGLENVVRMIAEGLGREGLITSVLCTGGGVTFDALAAAGVDVAIAGTPAEAKAHLDRLAPDVIEVHNAPEHLMKAVDDYGAPWIGVIHNTEIHRRPAQWTALATSGAARWIAVSESVRTFHVAHLPPGPHPEVVVVENASPAVASESDAPSRSQARAAVAEATGWVLRDDDVLVVSLSRYDAQKNIPGLVACFSDAVRARPALRLVVAGPTADWLEVASADTIRRGSSRPGHVALLGPSSSAFLLAAADAFVLDSYFEGGQIVAIEAARAGLPMVMSDAGISRELLHDGTRGFLAPNPATGGTIDEKSVRRARRHPGSQRNAAAVRDGLVELADHVTEWRDRRTALSTGANELFTVEAMIQGHAHWLKDSLKAGSRS